MEVIWQELPVSISCHQSIKLTLKEVLFQSPQSPQSMR